VTQAGCSCACWHHPRYFSSFLSWEKAQKELAAWLRRQPKPLGLMACSDRHAQRVLDACRRASLLVPDEVAVIGVDNDLSLCLLCQPPLSSVVDNPRRNGYEAARLLDRIMRGELSSAADGPIRIPPLGVITRRSTETTVTEDGIVAEALRFIREHACEDINAYSVSRHFPLSRSAFYLRFRKALGRSPHEEILRVRLERIKELLATSQLPVVEVSRLAGFDHPEYMGVVFKRLTGQTPGQYRAHHSSY
jgi:LacI family transcriptional regulator